MFAINANQKLVMFVHGFAGTATGTWLQFPGLLPVTQKGRNRDFVFYGYDGLRTRATVSAVELLAFLNDLFTKTAQIVNGSLPAGVPRRPANFTYTDVLVVAHSLGAVVSRQALLFAHKRGDAWAGKTRLVFFAPAHMGADVLRLVGEALTGLPGLIPAAFKYRYQVLQDLEPNSQMLQFLRDEVQQALPAAPYLAARAVIIAGNDKVVSPVPFVGDPQPPQLIPNRSHTGVCKPTAGFIDPLTAVENLL